MADECPLLHEYIGNLHLHTVHSDGRATHQQVAASASRAGLDLVMPTDHNVYVPGLDGWYGNTLLLVGEEIHNPQRQPEANHLLVFGVAEELAQYGASPQALIQAVSERGGLSFIAHPYEHSGKYSGESNINWVNWEVTGFTGLSIWNYMSEFKSHVDSAAQAIAASYFPQLFIRGPYPETLARWEELLGQRRTPVIGTSDAHGKTYHLGPLHRVLFPYEHLFRTVNVHILTREPFRHRLPQDAALVYAALREGRSFVAYDGLAPTRGFRFWAGSGNRTAVTGEELVLQHSAELRITAPTPADIRLLCSGQVIAHTQGHRLSTVVEAPGVYRAEVHRRFAGRVRGWIFSNPIYLR